MRHKLLAVCVLSMLVVSGCTNKSPTLKSPCVGASGSPCDERTPVNDWWRGDIKHAS